MLIRCSSMDVRALFIVSRESAKWTEWGNATLTQTPRHSSQVVTIMVRKSSTRVMAASICNIFTKESPQEWKEIAKFVNRHFAERPANTRISRWDWRICQHHKYRNLALSLAGNSWVVLSILYVEDRNHQGYWEFLGVRYFLHWKSRTEMSLERRPLLAESLLNAFSTSAR